MLAVAHHYDDLVTSAGGTYRARVYGRAQEDGMWGAWLVFFPIGGGRVISTERETTQSTFPDLTYWASGLTHTYLQAALERALVLQPEAELAGDLLELERMEASASARAETLAAAASGAETEARLAATARERTEERLLETVADRAEDEAQVHELAAATARAEAQVAKRALHARDEAPSPRRGPASTTTKKKTTTTTKSTSSKSAKKK
jgi:hypothetical protein